MVVIGAMSGTSLDGLDLAAVRFAETSGRLQFEWLGTRTVPYNIEWQRALLDVMRGSAVQLTELDARLGRFIGEQVGLFVGEEGLQADLVASHGHTIFHQPLAGYTTQIGHGAHLAAAAGLPVVCDFRTLDVAHGGQGAPLVPIGDRLLFNDYTFCLNLGGIANISYSTGDRVLAFDICACNMVLNYLAGLEGLPFDRGGALAASGVVDATLLAHLDEAAYFAASPPKSLGREHVERMYFEVLARYAHELSTADQLATVVAHIVRQVAAVLDASDITGSVLVTGGGAWNTYLIEQMQQAAGSDYPLVVPDDRLVGFKEALIFALLGYLRWHGRPNTLPSVTGAARAVSGGAIYLPS